MVDDLINPMPDLSDEELIRSLLWSVDTNRILEMGILQASTDMDDFLLHVTIQKWYI
jgi:hypothetical protein